MGGKQPVATVLYTNTAGGAAASPAALNELVGASKDAKDQISHLVAGASLNGRRLSGWFPYNATPKFAAPAGLKDNVDRDESGSISVPRRYREEGIFLKRRQVSTGNGPNEAQASTATTLADTDELRQDAMDLAALLMDLLLKAPTLGTVLQLQHVGPAGAGVVTPSANSSAFWPRLGSDVPFMLLAKCELPPVLPPAATRTRTAEDAIIPPCERWLRTVVQQIEGDGRLEAAYSVDLRREPLCRDKARENASLLDGCLDATTAFGSNLARLRAVHRAHDPHSVFSESYYAVGDDATG